MDEANKAEVVSMAAIVEQERHRIRMAKIKELLEFDCKPNNEGYGVENVHNPTLDIPKGTEVKDTQYVGRRQAFAYLLSRMIAIYHNETQFDYGVKEETGVAELVMDQYITLTEAGDPEYSDNIEVKWTQGQVLREWIQVAQAEHLPMPGWYDMMTSSSDQRLLHGEIVFWRHYDSMTAGIKSGVVVGFHPYKPEDGRKGWSVTIKEFGDDQRPTHLFAHQLSRDEDEIPPYSPSYSEYGSVEAWRIRRNAEKLNQ